MSFKLNWPAFSTEFIEKAKTQLYTALNKGDKPTNIVGDIRVHQLNMGTKPPDLEILEIGELQEDRFRGIFKMAYTGDAHLELMTKVQANPLHAPRTQLTINGSRDGVLAANWPLVVPMRLKISNLVLRGIIVLVVDKHKGVTLVFKNDPLEKVDVNSTFDNIPNIRRFLQLQIETQLRKMFQEDLPALIHNLSLVYFSNKNAATASDSNRLSSPTTLNDSGFHDPTAEDVHSNDASPRRYEAPRSMRERWRGNEAVDGDEDDDAWVHGYTFYRNLSASCGALDMGLKNLATPKPLLNNSAVCRSRISDRLLLSNWKHDQNSHHHHHHRHQRNAPTTPTRQSTSNSIHSYGASTARTVASISSSPLSPNRIPPFSASYANYRKCSTRPRIPPCARSSVSLHTDFAYDWQTEFHSISPATRSPTAPNTTSIPSWFISANHQQNHSSSTTTLHNADDDDNDEEPFDFDNPGNIFTLNPPPSTATAALESLHIPNPVTLKPTDNPRAAHLANLMDANRTLGVHTQSEDIEHLAFRAHPIRFLCVAASAADTPATTANDLVSPCDSPHTTSLLGSTTLTRTSSQTAVSPSRSVTARQASPAYDYSWTHKCTTNTFVVPSVTAARRSRSPSRYPRRHNQNHNFSSSASTISAYSQGTTRSAPAIITSTNNTPVNRPGSSLATRNITKLTLPPGVVIPQQLLSPGLDQRLAEMGYINHTHPQHPQYRRTRPASATNDSPVRGGGSDGATPSRPSGPPRAASAYSHNSPGYQQQHQQPYLRTRRPMARSATTDGSRANLTTVRPTGRAAPPTITTAPSVRSVPSSDRSVRPVPAPVATTASTLPIAAGKDQTL